MVLFNFSAQYFYAFRTVLIQLFRMIVLSYYLYLKNVTVLLSIWR